MKNIQNVLGLAHEGRYSERAKVAADQVRLHQEQLVTSLRIEVSRIDSALNRITDVGPETSDSLRPVHQNFDANTFVTSIQNLSLELRNAQIELAVAEQNYNAMFGSLESEAARQGTYGQP